MSGDERRSAAAPLRSAGGSGGAEEQHPPTPSGRAPGARLSGPRATCGACAIIEGIAPLVSVTDHAVARYLQRVRGSLDPRAEIAERVAGAWAAGRVGEGRGGAFDVRDRDLLFVVHHDRPRRELVVVTVWDTGRERFITEGRNMGFMDKAKQLAEQGRQKAEEGNYKERAKQLAEQGRQKLEEAQQQFNERQGGDASAGGAPQEYDQHGRPVARDEDKPHGDPLGGAPAPAPAPPAAGDAPHAMPRDEEKPHGDPLAASAPHAPSPPKDAEPAQPGAPGEPEDGDRTDHAPPKMTGGDPLAG
jgi:hypothetical protein